MLAIILVVGFAASVLGTVAGFGTSALFLSLALFFLDFKTALILTALFAIAGNVSRVSMFRKHIDKKLISTFAIPSVVLTIAGILLIKYASPSVLKVLLGFILIAFSMTSFSSSGMKLKKNKRNAAIGGGLSGFLQGLIGVGGPVRSAFLNSFRLSKGKYIATAAAVALLIDIFRVPIYFSQGFMGTLNLWYLPGLFLVAVLGSYAGKVMLNKISSDTFRKIILISIVSISMKFIIEGVYHLV